MKTINKSVLLWHSAPQMFALVTDVKRYPEFLPWCDSADVIEEQADGMLARLGLSFGGIKQAFTTRNTHQPDREVHMSLVEGPFSQLEGTWTFTPLGDGSQRACKVEFRMRYGFSNVALAAVVGPVFDRIAGSLVDAFVKRADAVHGSA